MRRFRAMPEVDFAEPNGIVRKAQSTSSLRTTASYEFQWNLKLLGADRAWAIQKGKPEVGGRDLDTGIAYEDFGPYRKAPDFGGTVFLPGFDFVNDDATPTTTSSTAPTWPRPWPRPRTTASGVAGLAFGCALMPVKVLDATGDGSFFDVAQGIEFATNFQRERHEPGQGHQHEPGRGRTLARAVSRAVDKAWSRAGSWSWPPPATTAKAPSPFPPPRPR